MQLQNADYRVTITASDLTDPRAICASEYDVVYGMEENGAYEHTIVFFLEVCGKGRTRRIALIGDRVSVAYHCAVLEDDRLTVLQNERVRQICLETGALLRNELISDYGCYWAIYGAENGYVIHGEEEIVMLDRDLCRRWVVSAREIYCSFSFGTFFEIENGIIKVYDFDDTYYEYDLNGRLIKEIPAVREQL